MKGVNKVILIGTLGRDPEAKTFPDGGIICNFSIATTEKWKDKNTNEWVESTEWHRIVFSGRLGDVANKYLKKGSKVYIEGSLRTRKWSDKQGQDRYITEIRGDSLEMLDTAKFSETQPVVTNQSGRYLDSNDTKSEKDTANIEVSKDNKNQLKNKELYDIDLDIPF